MNKILTKNVALGFLVLMLFVATVAIFAGCGDDKVKEIKITTAPVKTTYLVGEQFDTAGMVVTAVYGNNKTEVLKFDATGEEGYSYDLYRTSLNTTHKKVTFEYNGKKVSCNITVNKWDVGAPNVASIEYTALDRQIFVQPLDGAEYKLNNGNWQDSNVFNGLTNGITYSLSVRFKGTDARKVSDAITIGCIKVMGTQNAINDNDIVVNCDATTIIVDEISGAEYKLDDGKWGDAREFTGLTPSTSHTVYVRMKATETLLASAQTAKAVNTTAVGE